MFGYGIKYKCRLCRWFIIDVSDRQQCSTGLRLCFFAYWGVGLDLGQIVGWRPRDMLGDPLVGPNSLTFAQCLPWNQIFSKTFETH
jgi:hypothetical protein